VIAVTYHDDLKEVQCDPQLAALLDAPAAAAPFDRLAWWRALAEECGKLPLIAVARDGDARAVLPLKRKGRKIYALANWYSFTTRAVVSPHADAPALLRELAADLAGEAPHVVLAPVPDENGEATALAAAFRQAGWVVFMERCDSNHVLDVGGRSFADYLATRPGQLRTTLKRKGGKVECEVLTHFDDAAWDAYDAVYAASWKPCEGSPAFLRRFAREEGAAGRLRLGIARADGVPVAAQLWTVEAGTAFIHKLAHTEQAKPLSPGTALSAALFAHVIDSDRVAHIDFGTGDDAYKRDWMEAVRSRYRLEMFRPAWPGNWPAIARKFLRGLAGKSRNG
jgi:CelD/BcsL family acetyltransferase involved in cellulose biosynthesis